MNGLVAARPSYHLLFEVTDANAPADVKEPVLAHASVPLSHLLRDLKALDPELKKESAGLSKRLHNFRGPVGSQTKAKQPPDEESDPEDDQCMAIACDLALIPTVKRQDLRLAMSMAGGVGPQQALTGGGASASSSPATPPKPKTGSLPAGMLPCSARALDAIGARTSFNAQKDGAEGTGVLTVRFEAISRWNGAGRGPRRPPIRPMRGPSPVTCITTLVSSIVAGYEDGNIFVWDATGASTTPLHQFSAHKAPIGCMTFFPALDCLVTGGGAKSRAEAISDSVVHVWSCLKFELQQSVPLHGAHARVLHPLEVFEEIKGKRSTETRPCLALSTDTRQERLLHVMKLAAESAPS